MKLEVGKKYVDGWGNIWNVKQEINGVYIATSLSIMVRLYYKDGRVCLPPRCFANSNEGLVKEYQEPRPDVEVLGDLIVRVRYSQTCLSQETLDLLQEAEEMKKRMESK